MAWKAALKLAESCAPKLVRRRVGAPPQETLGFGRCLECHGTDRHALRFHIAAMALGLVLRLAIALFISRVEFPVRHDDDVRGSSSVAGGTSHEDLKSTSITAACVTAAIIITATMLPEASRSETHGRGRRYDVRLQLRQLRLPLQSRQRLGVLRIPPPLLLSIIVSPRTEKGVRRKSSCSFFFPPSFPDQHPIGAFRPPVAEWPGAHYARRWRRRNGPRRRTKQRVRCPTCAWRGSRS